MINVSQKQALDRWDVISENLKEAMFSEQNADVLWRICETQHLSEEQIQTIATLAGNVILGFIKPEDLTTEIQETLRIDSRIAQTISREIDQRIFSRIREEIREVYNPITTFPGIKPITGTELKKEVRMEPIKPAAIPPKPAEIKAEQPKVIPVEPLPTAVQPPKPEIKIPPKPISPEKPFMIHKEETEAKPVAEKKPAGGRPIFGWFKKAAPAKPKATESPIKVELETFGQKPEEKKEPAVAKTEAPKQKIIHYRNVETQTPFGKTEPFGKTPTIPFEAPKPMPEAKPFEPTIQSKPFGAIPAKPVMPPQQEISKPKIEPAPLKTETPEPFSAIQAKPLDAISGKPQAQLPKENQPIKPLMPTVKTEPKPVEPVPFVKTEIPMPPKEVMPNKVQPQPQKTEIPAVKPLPPKPEPIKPEAQAKPADATQDKQNNSSVINLDSF